MARHFSQTAAREGATMARWGELTPATNFQIAWEVREGKADPDDVM
jgi:hypothetical protein